ncbi:MAG: cytochrome-c peroxidase [Cyclobacteriaceae bacterium]
MKYFILIISVLLSSSCSKEGESDLSVVRNDYWNLNLPDFMGDAIPTVERNPISEEGITLGRMLFYDPILSSDGKVSCASCHFLNQAFTDGEALSTNGVSGNTLKRNSPPLFNLAWHNAFFWEGGAVDLESQVSGPIIDVDELGGDPQGILSRLNNHPTYPNQFKKVFNKDVISIGDVAKAIAQFERVILSYESRYDNYKGGNEILNSQELEGLQLYQNHCESCHEEGFFSDFEYHNNGLDSVFNFTDSEDVRWGRYRITSKEEDKGKYKTPSLRNIALTAPYMHDGRLETLEDVINHYSNSVVNSASLDSRIPIEGFQFTLKEKQSIIAFLKTLTDFTFVNKEEYQNPFN